MTVTFTKAVRAPSVHRWPDGTVATCQQHWVGKGLPHDLGHWLIEAQVDLRWGFWSLAGQQAPFASLELVEGRWPKGKQQWFDRVRRKHGLSMLHAEAQGGTWLADPDLDVHAEWSQIRDRLARAYAFDDSPLAPFGPEDVERLRPFALRATAAWNGLRPGGSVEVSWPGANDLIEVPTETHGAVLMTSHRRGVAGDPYAPVHVATELKTRLRSSRSPR
jgi:hypothetical protein